MPRSDDHMPFIGFRDGRNVFGLLCPVCRAQGEMGVRPEDARLIQCPNSCGALFMQRRRGSFFGKPVLEYIMGGKLRKHTSRIEWRA
jgi:hypothetical protein